MGQTRTVHVEILAMRGSIEELLLKLRDQAEISKDNELLGYDSESVDEKQDKSLIIQETLPVSPIIKNISISPTKENSMLTPLKILPTSPHAKSKTARFSVSPDSIFNSIVGSSSTSNDSPKISQVSLNSVESLQLHCSKNLLNNASDVQELIKRRSLLANLKKLKKRPRTQNFQVDLSYDDMLQNIDRSIQQLQGTQNSMQQVSYPSIWQSHNDASSQTGTATDYFTPYRNLSEFQVNSFMHPVSPSISAHQTSNSAEDLQNQINGNVENSAELRPQKRVRFE